MRELEKVRRGVRLWWWSHLSNPPVKRGEEGGAGACRTALQSKESLAVPARSPELKFFLKGDPCLLGKGLLKYGRHAQPLAWNSPCKTWPQCQCSFGFQNTHSCGWGSVEYSYGHYGDPILMFCNLCTIMYSQPSICHHISNNGAKEEGREKLV